LPSFHFSFSACFDAFLPTHGGFLHDLGVTLLFASQDSPSYGHSVESRKEYEPT